MSNLPGTIDIVRIFRYTLQGDGAGGYTQNAKEDVYATVDARITVMDADTALKEFGIGGKRGWKVLLDYCPLISQDGDNYLELVNNVPSVIKFGQIYRIVTARDQRDAEGVWHHSSLAIEKDEVAETT